MTTDNKAVARWDLDLTDLHVTRMTSCVQGRYILFTDHERVVGELHAELDALNEAQSVGDGTISDSLLHWHQRALGAESALAASCAEVEGLKDMIRTMQNNPEFDFDAAMENGNV